MGDLKQYLDIDVLTAAKQRINYIIDTFDQLWVSFSGGKDSLAVLKLVEEVYQERGITRPINVIFRDEEVIQDDVIDYVESFRLDPRYNFKYYAVRQKSVKYILGQVIQYEQWANDRPHVRQKPAHALTDPLDRLHDQNTMDKFLFEGVKGRIAFLQGIRADESLIRLRSVVNRFTDNYIATGAIPNVKICKPIYDWSQKDIFKYFYDRQIKYCVTYDIQAIAGKALRVATPLLAESAKQFDVLKRMYPTFYEQVIAVFPEMLLQERYYKELDRDAIFEKYPHSFDGIRQYLYETQSNKKLLKKFLGYVRDCEAIRKGKKNTTNLGGYPVLHVFKAIVSGGKQMIQPKIKPSQKDLEYEGL
jgi:predicted phosphoadenosine phosphosulfate sulfurtransferase